MRRGFSATLVDLLVKDGIISEDDVNSASETREREGGKVEDILVNHGFVDADDMLSYRALIFKSWPKKGISLLMALRLRGALVSISETRSASYYRHLSLLPSLLRKSR